MDFQFNPTLVNPLTPVAVEVEEPHEFETSTPRGASEWEIMAALMKDEPRDTLMCLMSLLEVPQMRVWSEDEYDSNGKLSRIKGGWKSATEGFVSYETAAQWIETRISELGLSAAKVHAWPTSHHSLAEDSAFRNKSFTDRVASFK